MIRTIFRYLFYSESDNETYFRVRNKHRAEHMRNLFAGSLPVFVAATISRAVVAIIDAITNRESYQTLLNFIYAFFIAQVIGYYVATFLPMSTKRFSYFFRIAKENAGFAWKEFLTLLLADTLIEKEGSGVAFGVWCVTVVIMLFIVALSNRWLKHQVAADPQRSAVVKLFEGEMFGLGLAYTLTIIAVSGTCGNAFAGILKVNDDDSESDDVNTNICHSFDFLYPMALTILVGYVQATGLFDSTEEMIEAGETIVSPLEKEEHTSSAHAADAAVATVAGQTTTESLTSEEYLLELGDSIRDGCCIPTHTMCCGSWDADYTTANAWLILLHVFTGYFVGCSWYIWSVLTFQFLFLFTSNGEVFGLFLFACTITYVAIAYMTALSSKYELDEIAGRTKRLTKYRRHRTRLLLVAFRLCVGWSWEEFVISVTNLILQNNDDIQYVWIRAIIKCLVATGAFLLGLAVEEHGWVYVREKIRDTFVGHSSDGMSMKSPTEAIPVENPIASSSATGTLKTSLLK